MTALLIGFAPVAWVFSQSTDSIFMMGLLHFCFWLVALWWTLNGTTKTLILGVQSVSLAPVSSSGTSLSLPLSSATNVAYIGITLQIKILSQVDPKTLALADATHNGVSHLPTNTNPIYLQAGADLMNFR